MKILKMDKSSNIEPFDGENYGLWKESVRDFLGAEDLLNIIDEPVPGRPSEDYKRKNLKAVFYIKKHIH